MINIRSSDDTGDHDHGFSDEQIIAFINNPDAFAMKHPDVYRELQELVGPKAIIISAMQKELQAQILVLAEATDSNLQGHFRYPDHE